MTTAPVLYWKLDVGESYLVLDRDPRTDVRALFAPREVWLRGRRIASRIGDQM